MGKLKKLKISKVKRNNQTKVKLSKQGKLKTKRHKLSKKQLKKSIPPCPKVEEEEEESDHGEDFMNMIEKDDLLFLQKAITNKSYNLLKQIRFTKTDNNQSKRKRKEIENNEQLEDLYDNNISTIINDKDRKRVHMALPLIQGVSVRKHFVEKENLTSEEESIDDEQEEENIQEENNDMELGSIQEENSMELDADTHDNLEETGKPVSVIDLVICREEVLKSKRFKIGILASSILENPEAKSRNLKILLDMMDERDSEVYITVRKLAMVSLLEVFKDLLPSYNILQVSQEGVKLKKDTLVLQNYEAVLLGSYKNYLNKLEKLSNILKRKKGNTQLINKPRAQLGEMAVSCMCDLLTIHPYFNFSNNIARNILPFLDNKQSSLRSKVTRCISQVFKEDKRGQLSLTIVRKLNEYIKSRKHSVYPEVITVLLSLRVMDVNLEKEKEDEMKQKKLMSHKQRILALSRRERKKSKQLEQVEKELLETKAEENKQAKHKIFTEITNIMFTIYFRVFKLTPNNKVLSACLEGLAKFAHCININFYQDLIKVIDGLIEEGNLGLREQLHCIQCIFTILSGQGAALNIDPYRFYVHLYKNILKIHCGRTHLESEIILKTLRQILIDQRKRITQARMIAFVKRMSMLSLQSQHNVTMEILNTIIQVMRHAKAAHVLLDTDCTRDANYQAEIEEPDYCNAHCTALYELTAFRRHYHSMVRQLAEYVIDEAVPTNSKSNLPLEIAGLSPGYFYMEYDPAGVAFKPAIPVPKKITAKRAPLNYNLSSEFEEYCNNVNVEDLFSDGYVDFYKACKKN